MEQQTEKKSFWQDKVKPFYENRFKPFWLDNNKRNIKIAAIVLAVIIVVLAVVAGIYINKYMNLIGTEPKDPNTEDVIYDEDEFSPIDSLQNASSLKELLKSWATNGGEKMSSKNVVNVLLLGLDESEDHADSIIVASINKKTDEIKLISVYRDSYVYMKQENGKERYTKITEAKLYGGSDLVVKCVEDNLKIKIDGYVSVNFKTFPQVIDALGGIDLEVKEYEAKYIRRTSHYKDFPYGDKVHLTGDQALVYSRIRHSDANGDVSRAARQRKVIEALIKKSKSASLSRLDKMAVQLLPYVRTNMSKSTILSLGSQAILQNWMDYPITQFSCPDENSGWGSKLGGSIWYWIVDFPYCAHRVQMEIYGTSNIMDIDNPDRVTALDLIGKSSSSSSSGSGNSGLTGIKPSPTENEADEPDVSNYEEPTGEFEVTEPNGEEETTRGNLFPTLPNFTLPERPTRPQETTPDVTEEE